MRRKRFNAGTVRRAVCSGLLVAMFSNLIGCAEPGIQPGGTNTPAPTTVAAQETPTPTVTESVNGPTEAPTGEPVSTPEADITPTVTPEALTAPEPDSSVSPTVGPIAEATPTPEPVATPEIPALPTPEPTGQPEYDTLLQNGWQRTEDFFGYREIFFSGKYDDTQLLAAPGRYEYRYTASGDVGITFSVIGEEGRPVQQFLDELAQNAFECYIEPEGNEDYRYRYIDNGILVQGRIYACLADGENRMRVEVRSSVGRDVQTEGYEFYLR